MDKRSEQKYCRFRKLANIISFYNYSLHFISPPSTSPLYAFGYGLSYTTFAIQNVRLEKKTIRANAATRVMADVTNTGKREGVEVVQMYIRDVVSSVTRPVKELKGFQKISLRPGEKRTVSFEITPDLLAFFDVNMEYVVEPGEFVIMVGNSSRDEDLTKVTLSVTR